MRRFSAGVVVRARMSVMVRVGGEGMMVKCMLRSSSASDDQVWMSGHQRRVQERRSSFWREGEKSNSAISRAS